VTVRVAVVTGSRAEFGLLEPVMRAINAEAGLDLLVLVAGAHLLKPAETWREVAARWEIAATVPMQRSDQPTGRPADAAALGRGVCGFADVFVEHRPGWVVVLGDRIEAFAAASAASVGGIGVAHIHGGDRAEGVADEAMRHAITKLAHLHLAATEDSAERIVRMGEDPARVRVVGSPALDGLDAIEPMGDGAHAALGSPEILFLMHPVGDAPGVERERTAGALVALAERRVLALAPNHDPGREGIVEAIGASGARRVEHLERREFIGLCKRIAPVGAIVGNSSAGLIEASALGLPAVNIGRRQGGRLRPNNVIDAGESAAAVADALDRALHLERGEIQSPFGDGHAGARIAAILGAENPCDASLLRKRCAY